MKMIQIDAFEVQLGAGLLLQFSYDDGRPITILADAGVKASGYEKDHVHRKLPAALRDFHEENRRIDLIIGTHYDADHLLGLPPIIEDRSIEIGEAWLPPVVDDLEPNAPGAPLREESFLAIKWSRSGGMRAAHEYLNELARKCAFLRSQEVEALSAAREHSVRPLWNLRWMEQERRPAPSMPEPAAGLDGLLQYFETHLGECCNLPGSCEGGCHADAAFEDNPLPEDSELSASHYDLIWSFVEGENYKQRVWSRRPELAAIHSLSMANLRKATAKNAITATNLAKVVAALVERGVPIRCHLIDQGMPTRFHWSAIHRAFRPGARPENAPSITLLGPSRALAEKHRNKLPVTERARLAFTKLLPIEGITESNELSYILRVDHQEQGILVTGDAGCVDFKPLSRGGTYYPELLAALSPPLDVVQVAHHGGHNAHFYRVLQKSPFFTQRHRPYLILSHATHDKYRPSSIFAEFIGLMRKSIEPWLLFTGEPNVDKVQGYEDLIHRREGRKNDRGDIRIEYNGEWNVSSHAIEL